MQIQQLISEYPVKGGNLKIREETDLKVLKIIQRINEEKSWVFLKRNKTDKPRSRLIKKKERLVKPIQR